MDSLTIELPTQRAQTAQNLRRWAEFVSDPVLAKFEGRVECDCHGRAILHPPASAGHGGFQAQVSISLSRLMPNGRVFIACPVPTADGVRAADVAWASRECVEELGDGVCFPRAPEICVEVLSPDNSVAEMRDKTALYFDAGAREVWHCSQKGEMSFFAAGEIKALRASKLCPDFPALVQFR